MMMFLDSSESKFIPRIFTMEPTKPLEGLKLVMNGVGITVKLVTLVTVTPLVVTEIFPDDAPEGTLVVMVSEVDAVTIATTPLKSTTFSLAVVLKFVPVMTTSAPTAPLAGLNPVIVGFPKTVKSFELVMVTPLVVTVIGPVVAPLGTVTVMLVVVDEITVALTPLNLTTLLTAVVLKFVPVIITVAPGAPLDGVKPVKVGIGNTVKLVAVVIATPFTIIDIGPVIAPAGTIALILVEVDEVMSATIPLNDTWLSASGVLKLVPVMVTIAPTAALEGLKLVIVGVGSTVKFVALLRVILLVVIEILPVVAPVGTFVVRLVAVAVSV
jgi:hypothetical protein